MDNKKNNGSFYNLIKENNENLRSFFSDGKNLRS